MLVERLKNQFPFPASIYTDKLAIYLLFCNSRRLLLSH